MRPYSVIGEKYVAALLSLSKKLERLDTNWAVGGDLCEVLRAVEVKPDYIEIITSREGAAQISEALKEQNPTQIALVETRLPRDASVEGKTYPVHIRSHYFEFDLEGAKVKVHGDLQYRVGDWDWGDTLEFTSEHVSVVGRKTPVVPLSIRQEIHKRLGWTDRAEKISQLFEMRRNAAGRV